MKNESPKKLEIFLLLALRQQQMSHLDSSSDEDETDAEEEATEEFPSAFAGRLSSPKDAKKFERLRADYQNKSEEEKQTWRELIESFIGSDEPVLDGNIHHSHIDAMLKKETPPMRKIIAASLPPDYQIPFGEDELRDRSSVENSQKPRSVWLERNVRRTFVQRFVALRDLPTAESAFDRLNGAQLARLARLAGIREVALACLRIEAVESVTAFLRRFAAEDARAIAAQLGNLPQQQNASDERLAFAENLVHTALESEPQPSAMLDLLGAWLIGILLCGNDGGEERIAYTAQKLPLEAAPKLPEMIEEHCRQTPAALQNKIAAEIESLAETIASTGGKMV